MIAPQMMMNGGADSHGLNLGKDLLFVLVLVLVFVRVKCVRLVRFFFYFIFGSWFDVCVLFHVQQTNSRGQPAHFFPFLISPPHHEHIVFRPASFAEFRFVEFRFVEFLEVT